VPAEIHVPELGESVTDATIGRWLKSEGDAVTAGEPVVELETDKINFEVEAEQDGVLQSIAKGEGETVGVGEAIGTIGEGNGAVPRAAKLERVEAEGPVAEHTQATEPKIAPEAQETEAEREAIREEADAPREVEDGGRRASPLVRRLAQEYDIDLAEVSGSGSGGRVTRKDVERLIREQYRPAAPERQRSERPAPTEDGRTEERPTTQEASAPAAEDGREERVRLSRRRQTIAQRLVEAQQTAAMLTTFNEADMTAVMELRRRRKDAFEQRYGARLGFMSFFTKAAVGALKAFPKINAELQGNELVLKHYYDIGVAVNTDDGLVVPVVRNADFKSFGEIEKDIAELAQKARDGRLSLEDLRGGTFTITNGGIFGSLLSTPILNIPQVAILGMHKIQDRPVAVNGQVVEIHPMMYLALSYDHRIVDGADAVSFLARIKELIEDPEFLLLEG